MTTQTDRPYAVVGNSQSEQAEKSTVSPNAGKVDFRILIELQVISFLLHQGFASNEDLARMRADIAASLT